MRGKTGIAAFLDHIQETIFTPWNTWRVLLQALYVWLGKAVMFSAFTRTGKHCVVNRSGREYNPMSSENISTPIHTRIVTWALEALWRRIVPLLHTTTEGPQAPGAKKLVVSQ